MFNIVFYLPGITLSHSGVICTPISGLELLVSLEVFSCGFAFVVIGFSVFMCALDNLEELVKLWSIALCLEGKKTGEIKCGAHCWMEG